MNKIFIFLYCALASAYALSCPVSPISRTAYYSDSILEKSDVMFLGRLESESREENSLLQMATFTVLESYKGNVSGKVTVKNELRTSCSRAFKVVGQKFYVFALKTAKKNVFKMPHTATFIPLGNAEELNWSPK